MVLANTPAYYDTAAITDTKSFRVLTLGAYLRVENCKSAESLPLSSIQTSKNIYQKKLAYLILHVLQWNNML
jgi:hypothetical protein